jgi:hypothetical protein
MKIVKQVMAYDGTLQKEECSNMGKLDINMKSVCNRLVMR